MAGVPWSYFLPEVGISIPDCPQLVMVNAIQNAARQFLRETELQTAELPAIDIVSGNATYSLVAPAGTEISKAEKVVIDDKPLDPIQAAVDANEYGDPYAFIQEIATSIRLVRIPDFDRTGGLEVKAVVIPTKAADSALVEEWIASRYLEEIAAGAKSRLLSISSKVWTDFAAAEGWSTIFTTGIAEAKHLKTSGLNEAPRRTKSYYR